jgi:two-component sensor histidine kinase
MIINELITNSLKHAFPDGRSGKITINLTKNAEEKHTMTVSDNGIGIPVDFDMATFNSLGIQIVQSLVKQIGGTMRTDRSDGLVVTILF